MKRNSYLGGSTIIYPHSSWFGRGGNDSEGWEVTRVEEIPQTTRPEPVRSPEKRDGRSTFAKKSNPQDQQKAANKIREKRASNKVRRKECSKRIEGARVPEQWKIEIQSIVNSKVWDQQELFIERDIKRGLTESAIKKTRKELLEEKWISGMRSLTVPELPDRRELLAKQKEKAILYRARIEVDLKNSQEEWRRKQWDSGIGTANPTHLPDHKNNMADRKTQASLPKACRKPKVKKTKEERLLNRYQAASDILFKK